MKKLLREFFFLRKGERRALMLVMLLLASSIVFRMNLTYRPLPEWELDPGFHARMKKLQAELIMAAEQEERERQLERERLWTERRKMRRNNLETSNELKLYHFDPNTISKDSLRLMNLPGYVAENIARYRNAGGEFRSAEEIGKIYGLDSTLYRMILPYVYIRDKRHSINERRGNQRSANTIVDTMAVIGLNLADSSLLTMIPGIGPSFSMRIIKYRDLLGGYHHPGQLMEVYGMDSVRYNSVMQHCAVDSSNLRRIDLNRASFKELISHPYISRSETYSILQYRSFTDRISHPDELRINQIIDHERFKRVAPYLEVKRSKE
ncbi:MAG: helix-hairpin-helix domain-containing protein [Bacteroidales bacterium]